MTDWVFTARLPEPRAIAASRTLEAALEEIGAASTVFEVDEQRREWEVSAYATDTNLADVVSALRTALPEIAFHRTELPETDWVSQSLEGLPPVEAAGFFVHGSHDRDKRRAGLTSIEIDAGQAFGTGHHGTTAGCLEAIDALLKRERPSRVLDVGTGSGVLAIALAKRLKRPIVASDIDPVAVRVARSNVIANGVGAYVRPIVASGADHPAMQRHGPYSLIVANILARPLETLAPSLVGLCAAGGTIILSGLLDRQRARVVAAYVAQGLALRETRLREGWATLTLERQRGPKQFSG